MQRVEKLIKEFLSEGQIMQLATVSGDRPWVCNVHYITDDKQNVYWLSHPSRRHSQELTKNNKAAVAIAIKTEKPVIGLQAEGTVEVVDDPEEIKRIMKQYVERFNIGGGFYDNFIAGKNQHQIYKLIPTMIALFDEVHFPSGKATSPRHEWRLTD